MMQRMVLSTLMMVSTLACAHVAPVKATSETAADGCDAVRSRLLERYRGNFDNKHRRWPNAPATEEITDIEAGIVCAAQGDTVAEGIVQKVLLRRVALRDKKDGGLLNEDGSRKSMQEHVAYIRLLREASSKLGTPRLALAADRLVDSLTETDVRRIIAAQK